jgi:hypothetical protein
VEFNGVQFTKEEVLSYQQFAPRTEGAKLLAKMVTAVEKPAQALALSVGSDEKTIRINQGVLLGLEQLWGLAQEFASMDLEKFEKVTEEEGEVQNDLMEAKDVGF